jgi:flagellar biosynthesis component FlhA
MDPSAVKFMRGLVLLGKILTALKIIGAILILSLIIWWLAKS